MTEAKRGARPDHIDVENKIKAVSASKLVTSFILGNSTEGYEIPGVLITNPEIAPENKQRAMIIAGQHGSEESGRSIALGLIDFLLSEEPLAKEIISKQEVVVVPSCNPEGAQLNIYHNAADINIAHVHEFDSTPSSPDALCVWQYAEKFNPELYIDIHGLAGGSMSDRVWMDCQHNFSMNRYYMMRMCEDARNASEALGFPTCEPKLPENLTKTSQSKRIGEKLSYFNNTLSFGVEAIEGYYTILEWVPAGLARIKALLSYGNNDNFGLGFAGYPNNLVSGYSIAGILADGKNAAERRKNRSEITQHLSNNFTIANRNSDGHIKAMEIKIVTKSNEAPPLDHYSVICRIKKPFLLKAVKIDNTELKGDQYQQIDLENSISFIIPVHKRISTENTIVRIDYESEFLLTKA